MKTYNCLQCKIECKHNSHKFNKFCSGTCQHNWYFENVIIPKFKNGNCSNPKSLKKILFKLYGEFCNLCNGKNVWLDKPLKLQIDHIDGNSDNNMPENLQILCPNCHSQTETFCSKGKGNRYKKITKRNQYLREFKGRVV